MIVYHGTPIGGERVGVVKFLRGRHALIPFMRQEDCDAALQVSQTVVFDNSAFTAWKSGKPITDWSEFYAWVHEYRKHPAWQWALIPDVIDGTEEQNDELIAEWIGKCHQFRLDGVPVWHLHESLTRLQRLSKLWPRIALGSSGEYPNPGTVKWFRRMRDAMEMVCDENGRPTCRLHGLRMAAPEYVSRFPFASVDSTNVAQNASLLPRFGMYAPPSRWQRAEIIARRMEDCDTTPIFNRTIHYAGGEHGAEMLFVTEPNRSEPLPA